MSEWAAKRFWKTADVVAEEGGFSVTLDGRSLRTPLKSALVMPSRDMAEAVAAEWQAQGEKIKPDTMPVTRAANSAIDKVATQHDAVAEMLAAYAETDLLCHRADAPEALVARQAEGWDPILDWAKARYGAPLTVTVGVLPVTQPQASLDAYRVIVAGFGPFSLTGLHDLVSLSGSLVLALAVCEGRLSASEAWSLSRIDEIWQIEQWGADEEAAEHAAIRATAFEAAARFFEFSEGA